MKNIHIILLLICSAAAACGGASGRNGGQAASEQPEASAAQTAAPVYYRHRVVAEYPHSKTSYTQGLFFSDGLLWEGTGQWGESHLQTLDPATGSRKVLASLPRSEFGEGIAIMGDTIYQLTWTSGKAHLYDRSGRLHRSVDYRGEGWGITSDGERLFMSDGSAMIYEIDPVTFKPRRGVAVMSQGSPVENINELEWIEGRIWANVYLTSTIVIIDPATGRVEGIVDLTDLWDRIEVDSSTDVLNGIAYDAGRGRIFVTGKNWNKLFEIEIFE